MTEHKVVTREDAERSRTTIVLFGAAAVAWAVTIARMRGMDAGPGTDLGGLGWYLGIWVTMMAAMMLPSVAPMVLLFHRVSIERAKRSEPFVRTWVFALAYLGVWASYGLGAYALYRLVNHFDLGFLAWDHGGRYVAGGAIVAAGLYELTPLKTVCLRHCRTPLHFVMGSWRNGAAGPPPAGIGGVAHPLGSCWGALPARATPGHVAVDWAGPIAGCAFPPEGFALG